MRPTPDNYTLMPTLTRPCRLESLRSEFGGLQLKDELDRQGKQKKLFGKAQKIFNKQVKSKHDKMEGGLEKELAEQARDHAKCVQASERERSEREEEVFCSGAAGVGKRGG